MTLCSTGTMSSGNVKLGMGKLRFNVLACAKSRGGG